MGAVLLGADDAAGYRGLRMDLIRCAIVCESAKAVLVNVQGKWCAFKIARVDSISAGLTQDGRAVAVENVQGNL